MYPYRHCFCSPVFYPLVGQGYTTMPQCLGPVTLMIWGSIEIALRAKRKYEMRRFMIAVVAVGVVFAAGASYAQEIGAPTMPEKVRGFLDNLTGTWKVDDEEGISKEEIRWDSGKGALIENGQFQGWGAFATWTGLWYWDGISEDGIILCVSVSTSHGFAHGELRGKVLSKTVMEGQGTGVRAGKKRSGNAKQIQSLGVKRSLIARP